jgi:hypothetical protein
MAGEGRRPRAGPKRDLHLQLPPDVHPVFFAGMFPVVSGHVRAVQIGRIAATPHHLA